MLHDRTIDALIKWYHHFSNEMQTTSNLILPCHIVSFTKYNQLCGTCEMHQILPSHRTRFKQVECHDGIIMMVQRSLLIVIQTQIRVWYLYHIPSLTHHSGKDGRLQSNACTNSFTIYYNDFISVTAALPASQIVAANWIAL